MTTWTPEEQKAHRKLWVEALRSGKYQQTMRCALHDDIGFCCLGVLADISGQGGWVEREGHNCETFVDLDGCEERGGLSPLLRRWSGLQTSLGDSDAMGSLSSKNDRGMAFADIADIIESEPEGLIVAQPVAV